MGPKSDFPSPSRLARVHDPGRHPPLDPGLGFDLRDWMGHLSLSEAASMKTVWKFPLEIVDFQKLLMPENAQILTVQMQHDEPCIWALVDSNAPRKIREVYTRGTGQAADLPLSVAWIGTYQAKGGEFVFHVFAESPI
jgi:hypothetical protein